MRGLREEVCHPEYFICFIIQDYRSATELRMCYLLFGMH